MAKRKIHLEFTAPEAQTVKVLGDFTQWEAAPVTLKKLKTGKWKTILSLEPGRYEYRFQADGVWQDNPDCADRVPNAFGSENCVLLVL